MSESVRSATSVHQSAIQTKGSNMMPPNGWNHAMLMIQDLMKIPSRSPSFPVDPSIGDGATGSGGNPSLHSVTTLQAGLLNKLTRSGLWRLQYVVLTESSLHFFSCGDGEYLGHHESQVMLRDVRKVEDGPALPGEYSKYSTLVLHLRHKESQIVLCAYDAEAQVVWKEAFSKGLSVADENQTKANPTPESYATEEDHGLTVLCVSTAISPSEASSANPAWGDAMVRMSPSWGDSMACRLEPGAHIRVWLSNGLVCCIRPEGRPQWRDSRTLAPAERPGFQLEYSLEGVSLVKNPERPVKHKDQVLHQQLAYGVLVLIMNATMWGLCSVSTAYWASIAMIAGALALGILPGPSAAPGSTAGRAGNVVRITLSGCVPEEESQRTASTEDVTRVIQRQLSTMATMARQRSVSRKSILSSVDPEKLKQLMSKFPDEKSEVKMARFLVARKHSVEAAIAMTEGDRELRSSLGPITNQEILPLFKADLLHFLGYAVDGTPVVFVKIKNLKRDESTVALQKLVLHTCDMVAALCPEQQCMTVLADMSGFSMTKNVDFNKLREVINVLNSCLPEVLRRVFVINAPYVFQAVWGFVQGLVDASTADKVRILGKKEWPLMVSFIDEETLPADYGGAVAIDYDPTSSSAEKLNWGHVKVPEGF